MKRLFTVILVFATLFLFILKSYGQEKSDEFPNEIVVSKTKNHIRVEGSKAFIIVPNGYEYFRELSRYQKNEKLYIQVVEPSMGSFSEAKPNFSRKVMESQGAKIDILKDIKINSFNGIYGEGPSKYPGETKLMLVIGDDDFLIMIVGVCKTDDLKGKRELQEIFKSIFYEKSFALNPLELADFDFDKSITEFKYEGNMSNIFMFSDSRQSTSENSPGNTISIGVMTRMSNFKAEEYSNDLLWRYENSRMKLSNKLIKMIKINSYNAFVLETEIEAEKEKGILYQVVLIGENKTILFIGFAFSNLESMLNKYKKTVKSIKIK